MCQRTLKSFSKHSLSSRVPKTSTRSLAWGLGTISINIALSMVHYLLGPSRSWIFDDFYTCQNIHSFIPTATWWYAMKWLVTPKNIGQCPMSMKHVFLKRKTNISDFKYLRPDEDFFNATFHVISSNIQTNCSTKRTMNLAWITFFSYSMDCKIETPMNVSNDKQHSGPRKMFSWQKCWFCISILHLQYNEMN